MAWMQWISTLMGEMPRQRYAAASPPDHFHCLLDELPVHLVPRSFFVATGFQESLRQPLFLNPNCSILPAGEFPEEFSQRRNLLDRFAQQGTVAWVRDTATASLLPFWLGRRLEDVVHGLRPEECAQLSLSHEDLYLLASAGILSPVRAREQRVEKWERDIQESGFIFRSKGYVPLTGLLHPYHVAALRRYYRGLIRRGEVHLGDQQSSRRYIAYNEPVARFFHHHIAATVAAVVGQAIKPSYVYMASYKSGAELKKHTDRAQCEFSVTLCLDFSPEPARETSWPIRLDTSRGTVAVYQSLGDGLVYRGTRLPHYRHTLAEGQSSTSIFFHYVREEFDGPLG